MISRFEIYKGIPIGTIIKRDLKKRGFSQKMLSEAILIPYPTLNKILNNHRLIKCTDAEKIESFFNYEPTLLIRLQDYLIKKNKDRKKIDTFGSIPQIRKCVFWDIDINTLDWLNHKNYIIQRAKKYANKQEIQAISNFYGFKI